MENTAKAALAAATESIEVSEKICPDNENLVNDCKAATVVTKVKSESSLAILAELIKRRFSKFFIRTRSW